MLVKFIAKIAKIIQSGKEREKDFGFTSSEAPEASTAIAASSEAAAPGTAEAAPAERAAGRTTAK